MKVEFLGINGSWEDVKNACRTTVGKEATQGEPSKSWKIRALYSEHSPIRMIQVHWKWHDLPYWVSVHFSRHKHGIEHFVRTQRTDRTGLDREKLGQGELVTHECVANLQAIINISRKRLCKQASKETREAWIEVLDAVKEHDGELYCVCVPDCIYRGDCREFYPCRYENSTCFKRRKEDYDYMLEYVRKK